MGEGGREANSGRFFFSFFGSLPREGFVLLVEEILFPVSASAEAFALTTIGVAE